MYTIYKHPHKHVYIYISGRFNVVLTQFPFQICGMDRISWKLLELPRKKTMIVDAIEKGDDEIEPNVCIISYHT